MSIADLSGGTSERAEAIGIFLNGHPRAVPAGLTVETLLKHLEIDPTRVAVELDRAIVRKPDWPQREIIEAAQVEVVWFVGGGI